MKQLKIGSLEASKFVASKLARAQWSLRNLSLIILMGGSLQVLQAAAATDPFGFVNLFQNVASSELKAKVSPIFNPLISGMNTGLYPATSVDILGLGLSISFLNLDLSAIKSSPLTSGLPTLPDKFYLPLPMIYAGAKIPVLNIRLFGRGLVIPKTLLNTLPSDITVLGGGLGYEMGLPGLPLILPAINVFGTYHSITGLPFTDSLSSMGLGATLAIKVNALIMSIKPFVHAGYYMANYQITLNPAKFLAANTDLPAAAQSQISALTTDVVVKDGLNQMVASGGLRFSLGPIDFLAEYVLLPNPVLTAGIGLSI